MGAEGSPDAAQPTGETPMNATKFLSTADAARVLNVTPAAIRLMARRGDSEGGIHLFRRTAVEALARRRAARKGGR